MKKLIYSVLILSIALLASCSKSGVDAPPTPVLDTDVESLTFPTAGDTKELKITSNVNWDVVDIGEGITVTPIKGKGNATLSVTMPKNETYEDTPKSFKIKSTAPLKTITVTQAALAKGLIHVKEAGTLASLLEANPSLKTETSLKITGTMNAADFEALIDATSKTLEVVDISELTITALPDKAFAGEFDEVSFEWIKNYEKLKTITLPTGLTSIESFAFSYCSSLESITLPAGVTSIGSNAFDGCKALASITIPAGVTSIEQYAFSNCTALTSIIIPETVTSIGKSAFEGCSSLKSITIPDGVTSIEEAAFDSCSALESITIPAGVTSIGVSAFYSCSALESITIPAGVTSIRKSAFYSCSALESITIPAGVTSIEQYAFYGCAALKDVTCMATTPPTLEMFVFLNLHAEKTLKVPAASVADYKTSSWAGYFLESVISGIADIHVATAGGLGALLEATPSLKIKPELKITGTMDEADFTALIGATKATLETLDISDLNITALPNKAFTELVEGKYVGYPKLKTIALPAGLKEIGNYAFLGCTALESISIPDEVTSIEKYAFQNCIALKSITLPSKLKSIGDSAFYSCTSLTSIDIPAEVITIEYAAFNNCSALTSITLPAKVTTIGRYAFYDCIELSTVTLPDELITIGDAVFTNCTALTTINIPAGVTSIGEYAFLYCSKLKRVTCLATAPPSLGANAFKNTHAEKTLKVPAGSAADYKVSSWTSYFPEGVISGIVDIHVEEAGKLASLLEANQSLKTKSSLKITGTMNEADFTALKSATKTTLEVLDISELNITALPDKAFAGDQVTELIYTKLKTITLPAGLESIGNYAFNGCSALTSITIPEKVTTIGERAFSSYSALKDVVCLAVAPPILGTVAFLDTPEGKTLKVPAASVAYYKDSSWTNSFPRNLISGIQ